MKMRHNGHPGFYFLDFAMALISPGIVYSAASMSTGNPNPRRVDEVTGPMEASRTGLSSLPMWARPTRPRVFASSATKFLTVEELVNVIIVGLLLEKISLARSKDSGGATVR